MAREELTSVLRKTKRETKMQKVFLCVACCAIVCAAVLLFLSIFVDSTIDWEQLSMNNLLDDNLSLWLVFDIFIAFCYVFEFVWYWQLADMNTEIEYRKQEKSISKTNIYGLLLSALLCGLANIISYFMSDMDDSEIESIVLVFLAIALSRFVFMFRVAKDIHAKWKIPYGLPNLPYSPGDVVKFYAIGQLVLFGIVVILTIVVEETTAINIVNILAACIDGVFYMAISYISIPRLRAGLLGINYPAEGSSNEADNTDNENDFDEE